MRVVHVAAEVYPLVKTGGLADVMAALPPALANAGADVRLLLPGLPPIVQAVRHQRPVIELGPAFGASRVRLLLGRMPDSGLPVYLVDAPYCYQRGGGPYQDARGVEWPDNLQRFALLGWVAAHLAAGELDPQWVPEVVHAHDWHAALSCAYLCAHPPTPAASVYTVHNLAYQGVFPHEDWRLLGLSSRFMSPAGLEYHGQLSFMKAGLKFADRVSTVSPTYAREIATPEFGAGLDGVIRGRGGEVRGILNGIDTAVWDPARDGALAATFDADRLDGKARCKAALQAECGLAVDPSPPLAVVVSRLTPQKGLDMMLSVLPTLTRLGLQLAVQGTGEPGLEAGFAKAAQAHPGQVSLFAGYDEARAHRMIAGADLVLVPSRFEPCGLTQMYGMRYGTLPLVRRVGGLADTVADGRTGFVFGDATPFALQAALEHAALAYARRDAWTAMMQAAMAERFDWAQPAREYLALYEDAVRARRDQPRQPPAA